MKRSKMMIVAIPVMALILAALIILRVLGVFDMNSGTRIGFAGNSTFHKYEGHYVKINGTFSHTLRPSKGNEVLHCEIRTDSGEVTITVTEIKTGKTILEEVVKDNRDFDYPADGNVRIRLKTSGHSGSYIFEY